MRENLRYDASGFSVTPLKDCLFYVVLLNISVINSISAPNFADLF